MEDLSGRTSNHDSRVLREGDLTSRVTAQPNEDRAHETRGPLDGSGNHIAGFAGHGLCRPAYADGVDSAASIKSGIQGYPHRTGNLDALSSDSSIRDSSHTPTSGGHGPAEVIVGMALEHKHGGVGHTYVGDPCTHAKGESPIITRGPHVTDTANLLDPHVDLSRVLQSNHVRGAGYHTLTEGVSSTTDPGLVDRDNGVLGVTTGAGVGGFGAYETATGNQRVEPHSSVTSNNLPGERLGTNHEAYHNEKKEHHGVLGNILHRGKHDTHDEGVTKHEQSKHHHTTTTASEHTAPATAGADGHRLHNKLHKDPPPGYAPATDCPHSQDPAVP